MQVQSHHQHQCTNAASSPLDISNLLCIHELYNTPLTWWPNRTLCAAGNKGNATFVSKLALAILQHALLAIMPMLNALQLRNGPINVQVQRIHARQSHGTKESFFQLWKEGCQLQRLQ